MPLSLALWPTGRRLRGPRRPWIPQTYAISGQTQDASGGALGGCTVKLYLSATDLEVASTVSDAGGNYAFSVSDQRQYYCVAYLAGSPDQVGTTVNTLVGA